jgi:hypothetical protein
MLKRVPFESVYISDDDALQAALLFQELADGLLQAHKSAPEIDFIAEIYSDCNSTFDDVLLQRKLALRLPGAICMSAVLLRASSIYSPGSTEYSLDINWKQPQHSEAEHRICEYTFNDDESHVERIDWDSTLLPPEIPRYLNSPERDKAIEEQISAGLNGLRVGTEDIVRLHQILKMGQVVRLEQA